MKPEGSFMLTKAGNFSASNAPQFEYLIVTADDYGYSAQRDNGIIESFNNGIVTRASLLVNGVSAQNSAVQLAKEHGLLLGIHLNLTEGKPLFQDGLNNSLLTTGSFFRGKFGFRDALSRGEISMSDVQ